MFISISVLTTLLTTTTSVLSAPAPSSLDARQAPALAGITLSDPTNSTWDQNLCASNDALPATNWALLVTGDRPLESGGCGEGILDNLRGRCGVITSWGCVYVGADGSNTAAINFWTTNGCSDYDTTQAVLAASYGAVNLDCLESTDPSNGPDISNLFGELFEMPDDGEEP